MAALLAAFHTAWRLVEPVAAIARGTRAVAEGDYEQRLPLPGHEDELSFLVASFNSMTRRLARARDAAARSQQAVEAERVYLETVLGRLSSGVVVLDGEHRLRTANPAAHQILGLTEPDMSDGGLDALNATILAWWPGWTRCGPIWRGTPNGVRRSSSLVAEGRQVLMCRGSPLIHPDGQESGHVVVFDDITRLITAQRDAAWGEVARRLAHEIKNPLTPIQLSAERLRHKLLTKLPEEDARVVDRATRTIVQQVEAMKAMVNDFSNYARSPKLEPEPLRLDRLVAEVMELYRAVPAIKIDLQVGEALIKGDPLRFAPGHSQSGQKCPGGGGGQARGPDPHRHPAPGRPGPAPVGALGGGQWRRYRRYPHRPPLRTLCHHQGQGHRAGPGHRQEDYRGTRGYHLGGERQGRRPRGDAPALMAR